METEPKSLGICIGTCCISAVFFAFAAVIEVIDAFNAPPPPHVIGMSPELLIDFSKAIGASSLAFIYVLSVGHLISLKRPTQPLIGEQLVRVQGIAQGVERPAGTVAYNAIIARSEDGELAGVALYSIGFVCEGRKGFTYVPSNGRYFKYEDAKQMADALNASLGHSKAKANRLIRRWS